MKYFELLCSVYLKQDIEFMESFDNISKYINFSMCQNTNYEKLHKEHGFKNYCFGGLIPLEIEKVYKKGSIYSFTLRSLDEEFTDAMQTLLRENINHSHMQVLQVTKKVQKQFFVSELYTVTPTIVTTLADKKNQIYWSIQKDGDILKLQRLLQDNLEKKYKDFYGESLEVTQNFIQLLEVKNRVPQSIVFTKNKQKIRLFGNKFKIVPHEDEVSQKLAFMALACGLGEKQSYGGGFCISGGKKWY